MIPCNLDIIGTQHDIYKTYAGHTHTHTHTHAHIHNYYRCMVEEPLESYL